MEIAIPFVQVETINPNVSDESVNNSTIYFKCICVCFATMRRFNPHAKLVLYTNLTPPLYFTSILKKLAVETRLVPYSFEPPKTFGDRFRGCFYIFDAIKKSKESTLFVDPDVLAVDSISNIENFCGDKFGVFALNLSEKEIINGQSFDSAKGIYIQYLKDMKLTASEIPINHLGGEVFFIPKSRIRDLNKRIEEFWTWNIRCANENQKFLPTEEHILTHLLSRSETKLLNPFISRIWTSRKFTKHQGNSGPINDLKLWHLPSEKKRGFLRMYNYLIENSFMVPINQNDFKRLAKIQMSVDRKMYKIFERIYDVIKFLQNH